MDSKRLPAKQERKGGLFMKLFRKLTTVVLTMALVFTMVNTQVKADQTITTGIENAEMKDGTFSFDSMGAGLVEGVYGARITFTVADESLGFGGGFIFNSSNGGWNSAEWGNDGAGKAITAVATGNAGEYTIERLEGSPIFEGETGWAEICLQSWWGSDLEITKVEILDASGTDLLASATTDATLEETTETTPVETTTESAADATPKTGDSMNVFYVVSILSLAAVVIISEKYLRKSKHC